jgi:hypothetical protein
MDVINCKRAIRAAGEALLSVVPKNLRSSLPGHFDSAGVIEDAQVLREFGRFYIQVLAVHVAAARLTSRGILIFRKRGCDIFVQDVGEVRFPALGEHVRAAISHENAIHPRAKAALA